MPAAVQPHINIGFLPSVVIVRLFHILLFNQRKAGIFLIHPKDGDVIDEHISLMKPPDGPQSAEHILHIQLHRQHRKRPEIAVHYISDHIHSAVDIHEHNRSIQIPAQFHDLLQGIVHKSLCIIIVLVGHTGILRIMDKIEIRQVEIRVDPIMLDNKIRGGPI